MISKSLLMQGVLVLLLFLAMPTVLSDNPVRPSELTISVSDTTPNVGDTVTVTLKEIPYEPDVDYIWFGASVYYGDVVIRANLLDRDMILDWNERGTPTNGNKYQATFSFVPEKAGAVTIDVYAHRQYDVTFADTQIYVNPASESKTSNENNNNDATDSSSGNDIPGFELLFVILAITLILVWRKNKF